MTEHPFEQVLRDAGLKQAVPKRPPTAAPDLPAAPSGDPAAQRRWAQAALTNECDTVSRVAEGARNEALNKASFSIGGLVAAGHLDGRIAVDELTAAGLACGLPADEVHRTVGHAIRDGAAKPRTVHLNPAHTVTDATTFENGTTSTASNNGTPNDGQLGRRTVRLHPASAITPKVVRWLWDKRIPRGELTLFGGREGIGKSTVAYTLVADITKGRMRGETLSTPRNVAVAATEDSWEHTIVPRLMAADADLERVFRVEVTASDGHETALVLPRDLDDTEVLLVEKQIVLLLLDPLLSRLDGRLDTHKDGEVRQALEPLVRIGQRTGTAILGLIHVNKGATRDPLTSLMASRAFAAVARAVLFCMLDPDDENVRLLGLAKSNLGPMGLPTLTFTIVSATVAETDEGPIVTGRVEWGPDRDQSVREAMEAASAPPEVRTVVGEAADWLKDHLMSVGGSDQRADIIRKGAAAGHGKDALDRARRKLQLTVENRDFPRHTWWSLLC